MDPIITQAFLAEVLVERREQDTKWSTEHDAGHANGELAVVAACMAWPTEYGYNVSIPCPDWGCVGKKPSYGRRKQLVVATALILAEVERLAAEDAECARAFDFMHR